MKGIGVALLLLLVLAAAGYPQVPDDKLIVPGQRIGKWTLEMTMDDLRRITGPPHHGYLNTAIDWTEPTWWTQWYDLFALTHGRYSQQVIALGTTSDSFKCSKGTGPDISREAFEAAHGRPTAVTVTFMGPRGPSWQTVIYDEIGLAGAVRTEPGTVPEFFVFRPGTAGTIWKF